MNESFVAAWERENMDLQIAAQSLLKPDEWRGPGEQVTVVRLGIGETYLPYIGMPNRHLQ